MDANVTGNRRAEVIMRLSEFEVPPMQDVLIIGKQAPVGPEAARRMADILSPEQYDIIRIDHPIVEALIVRKHLLNFIPKDKLISLILEEGSKIANESLIIKAQLNLVLQVSKSIDL